MEDIAQRLLNGDQRALSRSISLLEQGSPEAAEVMKAIDSHTGRCYTVGITGPPGAGKSTVVDRLAELLRSQGSTVGIIGVDPTSPFSGGAFLGDRIRMQRHYLDPGVFIRSVATRGQTGGVPRLIKSMVRLLDAAGKDVVLVETVGVGQTELGIMGVRLGAASRLLLGNGRQSSQRLAGKLALLGPQVLSEARSSRRLVAQRLVDLSRSRAREGRTRLEALDHLLRELSPDRILRRGFSVTRDEQGRAVREVSAVKLDQKLTTELASGTLTSLVTDRTVDSSPEAADLRVG